MKLQLFIYIFCLFILFIPNFIVKLSNKNSTLITILYSLIFASIFYFTFDLVNQTKESMDTTNSVNIDGTSDLFKVIGTVLGMNKQPTQIKLNNDLGQGVILDNKMEDSKPEPIKKQPPSDALLSSSSPSGEEIAKKAGEQYEESYKKRFENQYNQEDRNQPFKKLDGCVANYMEQEPCCGQLGTTVTFNRQCSKSKPICVNYLKDEDYGECISSGGGKDNLTYVLGPYSMPPWNINGSWIDQGAKWIWYTKNADKIAAPSSNAVFQYLYYVNDEEVSVNLSIACGCYCYVVVESASTREKTKFELQPTKEKSEGTTYSLSLLQGVNAIYFYCYNNGFESKPCGLLVSCLSSDNSEVLFHSDDSWTWFQSFPLLDSIAFNKAENYSPIIALYNRKYKGFLHMNNDGTMNLVYSKNKKVNNSLTSQGIIFKLSKEEHSDGSPTSVGLYHIFSQRFLETQENNKIGGSEINTNQTIESKNMQWIPMKNTDKVISLQSYALHPRKAYLSIRDELSMEIGTTQDVSAQWEVVSLDIIHVGTQQSVNNVPSSIAYVGITPINPQLNSNDTFMTILNSKYLYDNHYYKLSVLRTDSSYYATWKQNLLLPAINDFYFENANVEFELLSKNSGEKITQICVHKELLFGIGTNKMVYSKYYLTKDSTNFIQIQHSALFTYGSFGGINGHLTIGKLNEKEVMFGIGPLVDVSDSKTMKLGAIYYRELKDINKPEAKWELYSKQPDGSPMAQFTNITYSDKNNTLYGLIGSEICQIHYTSQNTTIQKIATQPCSYFVIHSLKNKGSFIIGINQQLYIFKQTLELETGVSGSSSIIANNLQVTKLVVAHNTIFALGKNDGKVYSIPLYGGILKEHNKKWSKNLIDIYVYENKLYALDNMGNILSAHIVL